MSGSKSPDAPPPLAQDKSSEPPAPNAVQDELFSQDTKLTQNGTSEPDSLDAPMVTASAPTNGSIDLGPDSEAETLIDSPVKRREAEKMNNLQKHDRSRHRIGSLPVPGDDGGESDTHESPVQSVENSRDSQFSGTKAENGESMDTTFDKVTENGSSDSLSSPRSTASHVPSLTPSPSRALSERPDRSHDQNLSPNPRKRKHRASSVSLPNKRTAKESTTPSLLQKQLDEASDTVERLTSPELRSHRRAVSSQSGTVDGVEGASRKRKQNGTRDAKSLRNGWEESDASSETTSLGNIEAKRPQRGIGRSTSTPGRPPGREHKRHVNKYGFTRLAEACEAGDLDAVKEWREKDPDQLELAEFASNKPLQIAALNGNDEVVAYLIDQGCQIDCANVDKDTPLIDAAENGHLEVVKILLQAGVDPLRQNLKGQQALDVVTDDTEDADQIRTELRRAIESWNSDDAKQRREDEEVSRHKAGTQKALHFMARSYENLLQLVTVNDRSGVREFLDARVPVDNAIVAAAAKTGDIYLVNMLLAEMTDKKRHQKAEKPMLAVVGTSHFDMVKALTELNEFKPLFRNRAGKSWPEIAAAKNGPNVRHEKELLQKLYNEANVNQPRRSSSPVAKREKSKRRHARATEPEADDSDAAAEVAAPRRKNGRRLLSRRDMRAASGKNASDSESANSSSERESTAEETGPEDMQLVQTNPSGSPSNRRNGAKRRKSASSIVTNSPPNVRRQSNVDHSADATPSSASDQKGDESEQILAQGHLQSQIEHESKELNDDAREREAREAREAREELLRIEDEARIARELEESKQKAEAARAAEEAQRLEEAAAEHKLRSEVLSALPTHLSHVLNPASGFEYHSEQALDYLLAHFTPLLLTKSNTSPRPSTCSTTVDDAWVLNAQVAPLLGQRGLELLMPDEDSRTKRTFSENWSTYRVFSPKEHDHVEAVIRTLAGDTLEEGGSGDGDVEMNDALSFGVELGNIAQDYNHRMQARRRLSESKVLLSCVRLADVLQELDPVLRDVPIQVRSLDWPHECADTAKTLTVRGIERLFDRFAGGLWSLERKPTHIVNMVEADPDDANVNHTSQGSSAVVVVNKK